MTLPGSTSGFANGTGVAAEFNTPVGMVLDGSGNLYVADQNNSLFRKIVIATGKCPLLLEVPLVMTTASESLQSFQVPGKSYGTAAVFYI